MFDESPGIESRRDETLAMNDCRAGLRELVPQLADPTRNQYIPRPVPDMPRNNILSSGRLPRSN